MVFHLLQMRKGKMNHSKSNVNFVMISFLFIHFKLVIVQSQWWQLHGMPASLTLFLLVRVIVIKLVCILPPMTAALCDLWEVISIIYFRCLDVKYILSWILGGIYIPFISYKILCGFIDFQIYYIQNSQNKNLIIYYYMIVCIII